MACLRLEAHNEVYMVAGTTPVALGDLLVNSGLSIPRVFSIFLGELLNQTQEQSLYALPVQGLER